MKPKAQPRHRQDSQPDKDALGRSAPKGDRASSVSPHEGCTGSLPDAGQVNTPTIGENAPAAPCGASLEAWRGSSIAMPGGRSVNRPSQRNGREPPASRAARIHTTCRSKPRRTCRAPPIAVGRWPGRSGAAGSAFSQGRQASRGGDGPGADPLKASEARSAAGAKVGGIDAGWP
jgi:hypothetical protein